MRGWRSARGNRDLAPPVEMRFVDMFLALVGTLIFLSLILTFLLRYLPPSDTTDRPQPGVVEPLQILTKVLPPSRVGEPYEVVLAYRGGTGAVRFSVPAGSQNVPPGLVFDTTQGIFTGTPKMAGLYRFVVAVQDAVGRPETRGYDLRVDPAVTTGSSPVSVWAAVVLLALLCLFSAMFRGVSRHSDNVADAASAAQASGRPEYRYGKPGRVTIMDLRDDRAIDEMRAEARNERRFSTGLAAVCLGIAAYIAWALLG